VALSTAPALNANDVVTSCKNTKLDGFMDTPLEATVNINLPILLVKVRLLLREEEGVDASI